MESFFDWAAVAIFAAIAVVFLQRSVGPARAGDGMVRYLPPVLMCAGANWLGNNGQGGWGVALLVAAILYFIFVLRPRRPPRRNER